MRSTKRFKCRHCKRMRHADPGNGWHQRYCSEAACRKASQSESQRRWLAKAGNGDYFGGRENTERVRQWRRKHPGYWKRRSPVGGDALQDFAPAQVIAAQADKPVFALQELALAQVPLLVGLVSVLTGDALQEVVVNRARELVAKGQTILGQGSGI